MKLKIGKLAAKSSKSVVPTAQGTLDLAIERNSEDQGIGMGVLSDGTPYLNQRGLAALCGVENAHIGTISSQWNDDKPRIRAVKSILQKTGSVREAAHYEITHKGVVHFCYPADVSLAIIEYYAFDAGDNVRDKARDNFRILAGTKLRDLIYSRVGYDPSGVNSKRFQKWHERLELNFQSAPKGFFHVFNESNSIIYELIVAGAEIDEKFVVDLSIGKVWSTYWVSQNLSARYGEREKYPHRYPDDHPQALSNPQESWCYPLEALGSFRKWLQDDYIEGGKYANYLDRKVKNGELAPSFARLALDAFGVSEKPKIANR